MKLLCLFFSDNNLFHHDYKLTTCRLRRYKMAHTNVCRASCDRFGEIHCSSAILAESNVCRALLDLYEKEMSDSFNTGRIYKCV